jgi:hypothetical protein
VEWKSSKTGYVQFLIQFFLACKLWMYLTSLKHLARLENAGLSTGQAAKPKQG